jgi:hypothetical protein
MRKVSLFHGLAAAIASLAFAGIAHADTNSGSGCKLRVEPSPNSWTITGYDPLSGGGASGEFDVVFTNSGDAKCQGNVVLKLLGEPWGLQGPHGGRLPYTILDQFNGGDVTPTSGQTSRRLLGHAMQVDPGERKVQRFSLVVNTDNLPSDGVFQQTVLLDFQTDDGTVLGERQISLALNIAPAAVMGLKGAFSRNDRGARIDLGELATGATNLPVELYVLSTRAYSVSVQSEHNGRLKWVQGDWYIPYSLTLGGKSINLATGGQLKSDPSLSLHNDSYPLGVVVGNVSNSRAGNYADVLTLTVSPL